MDTKEVRKIVFISSAATLLIGVVVIGGGFFVYTKYLQGWISRYKTEQQSNSILNEAGKVIRLPTGEKPQVSMVLDADKLKQNDTFFMSAQNGNAILVYEQSGLIVLFDPSRHKVLNMGMVATSTPK
jgi:hypothetical protein